VGVAIACLIGIQFGVHQLVVGLMINGVIMSLPALIMLRQRIGLSLIQFCKPCIARAGAALFMVGVIQGITYVLPSTIHPALRLACHTIAGGAAYLGFLQLFSPATLQNLKRTLLLAIKRAQPATETTLPL